MYKVIIAEDEVIFRKYLECLIDWNLYGFEVSGLAKNGIEALELCECIKPDLALLDINMPKVDGLTLAEQLKGKFEDMSIVLMTGYSEFEFENKAIQIGIEDYLTKPIDENDLLTILAKIKTRLMENEKRDGVH